MTSSLVCQQCKEPLQLDASLIELAPSAHDAIVSSLPGASHRQQRPILDSEKLYHLPAPASSKAAWQRLQSQASPERPLSPSSPLASATTTTAKGSSGGSPLPGDSFVFLKDSVVHKIPAAPSISQKSKEKSKEKSSKVPPATQTALPPHRPTPPNSVSAGDLHSPNPSSRTHHLRSTVRLFNLLSTRTDVDHPLCAECTQILLTSLQKQLEETKKERDGYLAFEREIRRERERELQGLSQQEAEAKIANLIAEQEATTEELKKAERERQALQDEMDALEQEEKALEEEENAFWKMYNNHLLALERQNSQLAGLRAAYTADSATLRKLERTNVYNDTFCIGHDGVFGTINGLRLGRVSSVSVDWSEINAAWGQTLLLLYTIARKLDFTFDGYRLVPMGSFSRIEKTVGDKAVYELYGSGDLHLGRLLHNRRFDFAMVSFLDCLKHLMDYIKSQDPQVDFPHQVVKDRIGDVSVKLQFNQEESWTRALRHVLLALKICLRWATNGANG